jgi:integrase
MYFSLNYRKKKSEYKPNDELIILIRYYHKMDGEKNGKVLNHSTGIKVKLKDWDENWDKSKKREPIKKTDKDYKRKNLLLKQKERELQQIIGNLKVKEDIEPLPKIVKSVLKKKRVERRKRTYSEVNFLYMFQLFETYVKENYKPSYKTTILTQIKYIREFCENYELKENISLLVEDINEEFIKSFVIWCYQNQNLQPSVLKKRLRGFTNFRQWMLRVQKQNISLTLPTNVITEGKNDIIYLTRDEIKKIFDFKDFDYANDNYHQYLKKEELQFGFETDERTKIKSEELKKRTYTNYEIVKDMLLFLCSVGCRYGDMLNMKLDNFRFFKDETGKEDRTKGTWEFRMEKVPRRGKVVVPSNRISFHIWCKYSSGKVRGDYLFPRTKFGNPISNQKFNKHIKEVCRIIGIEDLVDKPRFDIDGKPIKGTDVRVPKWNVVSSHIGRRSFIREQIELGKHQREIMLMTGHTSLKVFYGYYDIKPSDLWKNNNEMYFGFNLSDEVSKKKSYPTVKKEVSSNDGKSLEEKLKELKSYYEKGLLPELAYNDKVKELMETL